MLVKQAALGLPEENLADRLADIFMIYGTDIDLSTPRAAGLVRSVFAELDVELSDKELAGLMMRVRNRRSLGLAAKRLS